MAVFVPAGYADPETLVLNEMTLDSDNRVAALSGEYGGTAFRITISGDEVDYCLQKQR